MTLYTSEPLEHMSNTYDRPPRPPRTDMYNIQRFTENDNPKFASLARSIHAIGYQKMGFVKPSAITVEGHLLGEIDKARGPLVDYYVGPDSYGLTDIMPNVKEIDAVTMRKISVPAGGTVFDLPAYQACRDSLYYDDHAFLLGLENADTRLREIGALAGTPKSHPTGIYELLRNAIHEAQGRDEVWIASIVSTTYDSLSKRLGKDTLRQIGEPVPIRSEHVNDSVALVPVVTTVDNFVNAIYQSAAHETNEQAKRRQMDSFLFFAEGLHDDELGNELAQARAELSSATNGFASQRRA